MSQFGVLNMGAFKMITIITLLVSTVFLFVSCTLEPRTDEIFEIENLTDYQFLLFRESDLSGAIESTGKTADGANDPIYELSKIPDRCWVQKRLIKDDDSELCLLIDNILTCGGTRFHFPLHYICPVFEE